MRYRLLAFIFGCLLVTAGRTAAPAHAREDTTDQAVALMHATYDDLLALFYRPLDPATLLKAAWAPVDNDRPPGFKPTGPLGALPADQGGAFAAFEARLRQYAKTRFDKTPLKIAYVAADAMVKSLHEQHTNFLAFPSLDGLVVSGRVPGLSARVAPEPVPGGATVPASSTPLSSRMLAGNVGYVRLAEFADSGDVQNNGLRLLTDFDRRLGDLDAQGATALILDLRDNPGGSIVTADALLGRFLPEDTLTATRYDERGHQVTGIVGGLMRGKQLPMVVLVNGNSASAAEDTASTLRENDRAILVGEKTMGALATSGILPLPGNAGLQIATAEQVTARNGVRIDENGFPVDIEVKGGTSAASVSGTDPQLDAALAAIPRAPAPPAVLSTTAGPTRDRIHTTLSGYPPDLPQLSLTAGPVTIARAYFDELVHPNQLIDSGARDPLAVQQAERDRGWLGRHVQEYYVDLTEALGLEEAIDVYASPAGAAAALASNDFPETRTPIGSPVKLGDGTVTYRGTWMELGSTIVSWQRGNAVVSVTYASTPGHERSDIPGLFAQYADQVFDRYPLRVDLLTTAPPALPPVTKPDTQAAKAPAKQQAAPQAASDDGSGQVSSKSSGLTPLVSATTFMVTAAVVIAIAFLASQRKSRDPE